MNKLFTIILIIIGLRGQSQTISVCSWNLKDFGKSKSDTEITFIANTVKQFDILAIQEVVAGPGGAQAVARLADQLNRTGNQWDYTISPPTSGSVSSSERYAYLWKSSKVKKVGEAWLEQTYHAEIDREPYFCKFSIQDKTIILASFHAITKSKQPEQEIKYFEFFPSMYRSSNLIFCGDFNLPQSHSVFNLLRKQEYTPALVGQKTSLRQKCLEGDCLASEFDNFFYNREKVRQDKSYILPFYLLYENIKEARLISDHVPIGLELTIASEP